uniref:Uncharacterized protein n=1 Tax=Arundo donax TaxID=35708 RepID=A0A0A9E4I5_ARUDO
MMLMVCRPPMRLHESGGSDLGRMMHSSSSCSLATRTTSRRHGTKTSVTGMIQIARSRISIAARFSPCRGFASWFLLTLSSSGLESLLHKHKAACFPSWTSVCVAL